VIDAARNIVLQTLHVGKNPYALVVDPDSGRLYVESYAEPPLAVVDPR
jgi:DNA-binding beta-propeller fold protein YncE